MGISGPKVGALHMSAENRNGDFLENGSSDSDYISIKLHRGLSSGK
jgi:hypothetical protein